MWLCDVTRCATRDATTMMMLICIHTAYLHSSHRKRKFSLAENLEMSTGSHTEPESTNRAPDTSTTKTTRANVTNRNIQTPKKSLVRRAIDTHSSVCALIRHNANTVFLKVCSSLYMFRKCPDPIEFEWDRHDFHPIKCVIILCAYNLDNGNIQTYMSNGNGKHHEAASCIGLLDKYGSDVNIFSDRKWLQHIQCCAPSHHQKFHSNGLLCGCAFILQTTVRNGK